MGISAPGLRDGRESTVPPSLAESVASHDAQPDPSVPVTSDLEVRVANAVANFDHLVGQGVRAIMSRRIELLPQGETRDQAATKFVAILTQEGEGIAKETAMHLVKLIDERMGHELCGVVAGPNLFASVPASPEA